MYNAGLRSLSLWRLFYLIFFRQKQWKSEDKVLNQLLAGNISSSPTTPFVLIFFGSIFSFFLHSAVLGV